MEFPSTYIFASNIPIREFDEVKRSFWDEYLNKCGGKYNANINGDLYVPFRILMEVFVPLEFPCGDEIISNTAIENPSCIITINGQHKHLASTFLSGVKQRDASLCHWRNRRFGSFPEATVVVAIKQYSAVYAFNELASLFCGTTTEADYEAMLERLRKRMFGKHFSNAKKWFERREEQTVKTDFLAWREKYSVFRTDYDEFSQLVKKVTDNDLF